MTNATLIDNTYHTAQQVETKVAALTAKVYAENEDTWTEAMVAGFDAEVILLDALVADVAHTVEWYELEDEDLTALVAKLQDALADYAEFRQGVKEIKGW